MSELKVLNTKTGIIKLSDGTTLRLKITVVNVREIGFSPLGGINFDIKPIGGVGVEKVPEELLEKVRDKPVAPPEPPKDGWEIIEIVEQEPAIEEIEVDTTKGKFIIKVIAEAVMASRNLKYKSPIEEPLYWVHWVWKVSWRKSQSEESKD